MSKPKAKDPQSTSGSEPAQRAVQKKRPHSSSNATVTSDQSRSDEPVVVIESNGQSIIVRPACETILSAPPHAQARTRSSASWAVRRAGRASLQHRRLRVDDGGILDPGRARAGGSPLAQEVGKASTPNRFADASSFTQVRGAQEAGNHRPGVAGLRVTPGAWVDPIRFRNNRPGRGSSRSLSGRFPSVRS